VERIRKDDAAKKIFSELQDAETALKVAEQAKSNAPRGIMDAQRAAAAARAEADYMEAKAAYDSARRSLPERGERELLSIRKELADAVNDAFSVDPTQVDSATVELLKSGICTAADYEKLLGSADEAQNGTMIRLIASYAAKAAEALREPNGQLPFDSREEWARLDNVGKQGANHTAATVLDSYDALSGVFHRCVNNPAMIDKWGTLTENIIDEF